MELLGLEAGDCVLVRDRLATDIAMAVAAGMPSAVVLTGDTTPELLAAAPPGQRPDWVLDRIDRLLPPSAWPGRAGVAASPGDGGSSGGSGMSGSGDRLRDEFEACFGGLAAIGQDPAGGWTRLAWTDEDRAARSWFESEATARGLTVEQDPAGNLWAWWPGPAADRGGWRGRGREPPGHGPAGRGLRRGPRGGQRAGRGGGADRAGGGAGAAGGGGGVRRRGGRAVRGRRPSEAGSWPGRSTRRTCSAAPTRTGSPSPRRWPPPGSTRTTLGPDPARVGPAGRVRRAARRAGPRPGRPRPAGRAGHRHLAPRALAAHPDRRGQPRRDDPAGRPARPDARPGRGRPGRPGGRHRAGRGRDRRPGRGRAQLRQLGARPGLGLAGRAGRAGPDPRLAGDRLPDRGRGGGRPQRPDRRAGPSSPAAPGSPSTPT